MVEFLFSSFVAKQIRSRFNRAQNSTGFQNPHLREQFLVELEDVRLVSSASGGGWGRRGGPDEEDARLQVSSPLLAGDKRR